MVCSFRSVSQQSVVNSCTAYHQNLLLYQQCTLPLVNSDHMTILTISTTIMTNIQMLFILCCWDDHYNHFISVSAIASSILTTILTNIQMFKCSPTIFRCSTTKMSRCSTTKMFRCFTTTMFRIWTSDVLPAKGSDAQSPKCSESELQMFDQQNVQMFILCCLDEHPLLLRATLEDSPQSERWTNLSFNEDYGLCLKDENQLQCSQKNERKR